MFVSTGAGPVGTMVIEYAKAVAPHLKIIASAGSKDKVEFMRSIGVDVAFNYKEEDTTKILKEHGPIDMFVAHNYSIHLRLIAFCSYWDNVAGPILDGALENMNMFGLIVACGAISGAVVKSPVYVSYLILSRIRTFADYNEAFWRDFQAQHHGQGIHHPDG